MDRTQTTFCWQTKMKLLKRKLQKMGRGGRNDWQQRGLIHVWNKCLRRNLSISDLNSSSIRDYFITSRIKKIIGRKLYFLRVCLNDVHKIIEFAKQFFCLDRSSTNVTRFCSNKGHYSISFSFRNLLQLLSKVRKP